MAAYLGSEELKELSLQIGERLGIDKQGLHVAAVFEDNNHNDIIGWAVLNSVNQIVKRYDKLEKIFEEFEK